MKLHRYFADGAILQRDVPIKVRAHGPIGPYTLVLRKDHVTEEQTVTNVLGPIEWELLPHPAGGPYTLTILNSEREVEAEVRDLYFGDVFLLAGQSNMQLTVDRCLEPMPRELATTIEPRIRTLRLAIDPSFDPEETEWPTHSGWLELRPEYLLQFGALGLAFARDCFAYTAIPLGLLNVAVGGTPIEAWLPWERVPEDNPYRRLAERYYDDEERHACEQAQAQQFEAWYRVATGQDRPLYEATEDALEALDWQVLGAPGMFFETPWEGQPGLYWLTTRFELTAAQLERFNAYALPPDPEDPLDALHRLRLDLGQMIDHDEVYLNGRHVGSTFYRYPPRRYALTASHLKLGTNRLLIRLFVHRGTGGQVPEMPWRIYAPGLTLPLEGPWKGLQVAHTEPMPPALRWDTLAGAQYYRSIQPIQGFHVRAILWYQGESNDQDPTDYGERFYDLIRHYRAHLAGEPPFFFVSLPAFEDPAREVPEGSWDQIRADQSHYGALAGGHEVPALGLGETNDLHPEDKWSLGQRLWACYQKVMKL